jgi:hypothetical protein
MWLKKAHAGSASGGYEWKSDGAVIEVPDEMGAELIEHPGGEFTEADKPAGAKASDEAKAERDAKEVAEGTPVDQGSITIPAEVKTTTKSTK